MSLLDNINIEEFLDPASDLPPDVTFAVQDQEDKTVGKVVGHKMFLAAVSVVFRRIFFGAENKDKHSNVVIIKETTLAAFQAMVGILATLPPILGGCPLIGFFWPKSCNLPPICPLFC